MARYNRVVSNIERCFRAFHEKDGVSELTFHTVKQWMNSNTKDGITSAGLANLLRRRSQFRRTRTERKVGTNITTSFWTMTTLPKEWVVCYTASGETVVVGHYKTEEEANLAAHVEMCKDYLPGLRVEARTNLADVREGWTVINEPKQQVVD